MKHAKLTDFFQSLHPSELRWLRDFVASPYFNKQEELIPLCEYFINCARRDFPDALLERKRVYSKLFPGASFDEKQLAYLASDLLKLGERFLAQRQWEQDGYQKDLHALKAQADRRLDKSYRLLKRRIDKQLTSSNIRDTQHYFYRYQLADIAEHHTMQLNVREFAEDHLGEGAQALDVYYLISRLSLSFEMLNRQHVLGRKYDELDTELLRTMAKKVAKPTVPLLQVFLALLDALESKEEHDESFERFYQLFLQKAKHFSSTEQRTLCYCAINYCIVQLTQAGKRQAADRLLQIYEEGLQYGFLLEDNKLSPWDFKNITKLGLGLKRFEWVEQFLNDYLDKLPAEQRQDAQHFNLADLNYHKKNYDTSLIHLNRVEFSDLHYSLGAKAMLLKIYYETKAEEAFLSLAASFRLFLKRNKLVSSKHKKAYLNFIQFSLAIHKKGKKETDLLEQQIRETPQLNARSWLLQMLKEKAI